MVSLEEIARAARRYDTNMALAMRRALSIDAAPRRCKRRGKAERRRYTGAARLFLNRAEPMGWRGSGTPGDWHGL